MADPLDTLARFVDRLEAKDMTLLDGWTPEMLAMAEELARRTPEPLPPGWAAVLARDLAEWDD